MRIHADHRAIARQYLATFAWAQTATPPSPAKGKLERLRTAVAPVGWDTNFTWLTLRKSVQFHDHWGEFTAKDVRPSIFLITQPEAVQTVSGLWRTLIGIEKADTIDAVAQKVAQMSYGLSFVFCAGMVEARSTTMPETLTVLRRVQKLRCVCGFAVARTIHRQL